MIIAAMYLLGVLHGAWSFQVGYIIIGFILDLMLASVFGNSIGKKYEFFS